VITCRKNCQRRISANIIKHMGLPFVLSWGFLSKDYKYKTLPRSQFIVSLFIFLPYCYSTNLHYIFFIFTLFPPCISIYTTNISHQQMHYFYVKTLLYHTTSYHPTCFDVNTSSSGVHSYTTFTDYTLHHNSSYKLNVHVQ
jgi:hypothetical protein